MVVAAEVRGGVAGQKGVHRPRHVRTGDLLRPSQGRAVAEAGAAFGRHQVVEAVVPVQMRPLQAAAIRGAAEDARARAAKGAAAGVVLLEHDRARMLVALARIPLQCDQPVPAVLVVEEGGVEAETIQIDRLAPRTPDILRRDQEVVDVEVVGRRAQDQRVGQIEQLLRLAVGQAGRPDALMGRQPTQVVLRPAQPVSDQRPVCEVGRMEQPDAGLPHHGRGCEVVVLADPDDGRVGVEAPQHGIVDHREMWTEARHVP